MGDRKEIDNPIPARWQTGAEIKRRRTGNAGQSSRWGRGARLTRRTREEYLVYSRPKRNDERRAATR